MHMLSFFLHSWSIIVHMLRFEILSAYLQYHVSNLIFLHFDSLDTTFCLRSTHNPRPTSLFHFFLFLLKFSFFLPDPSSLSVCTHPIISFIFSFLQIVRTHGRCSNFIFFSASSNFYPEGVVL